MLTVMLRSPCPMRVGRPPPLNILHGQVASRLRAVDFGIGYFATHDGVAPGTLAGLVEERGHESLFFPEHTHIPASRETPYPAGGELPRKYFHTYDLFVALTAAAAATSKLRVGSGICLVIERDPITTAKEVASVDDLSGGRLEFGVGAGWNRPQIAGAGLRADPVTDHGDGGAGHAQRWPRSPHGAPARRGPGHRPRHRRPLLPGAQAPGRRERRAPPDHREWTLTFCLRRLAIPASPTPRPGWWAAPAPPRSRRPGYPSRGLRGTGTCAAGCVTHRGLRRTRRAR